MDGRRPTIGQRIVRALAGWLTVGGLVGALWTLHPALGFGYAAALMALGAAVLLSAKPEGSPAPPRA